MNYTCIIRDFRKFIIIMRSPYLRNFCEFCYMPNITEARAKFLSLSCFFIIRPTSIIIIVIVIIIITWIKSTLILLHTGGSKSKQSPNYKKTPH